jgi:negative regulator of sigma E activity
MNERFSAWLDGELASKPTRQLLSQMEHRVDIQDNWVCYHLIGDTLRGAQEPNLCPRICAQLEAEETVRIPRHRIWAAKFCRVASVATTSFAALVLVTFVGWKMLPNLQQKSPQIAALPATEVNQAAMPLGEGARGYLFAHQQYSPSQEFQGISAYARTVIQ